MFTQNKHFNKVAYLALCLVAVLSFAFGYIYTTGKVNDKEGIKQIGSYEGRNNAQTLESQGDGIVDVGTQNVISEDALITRKVHYKECGHTISDTNKASQDISKLTELQFKVAYSDWNIEKFDKDEIIVTREVDDRCPEHYIVKEKDGKVAVYYQRSVNGISLKEITNISISNLPNADQTKLREGIKVDTNQSLAELLEDLGS